MIDRVTGGISRSQFRFFFFDMLWDRIDRCKKKKIEVGKNKRKMKNVLNKNKKGKSSGKKMMMRGKGHTQAVHHIMSKKKKNLFSPARINVPRLTVIYSQPDHINSGGRK